MKILSQVALFLVLTLPAFPHATDAESQIKAVLTVQVDSWNRGDIPTFVTTYADDCVFVSKHLTQGRAQPLDHYKKAYPTRDAMGHLTFTNLAVHLLDNQVATVTADWHLERSAKAGGPVGGYFSLVFQRQNGAWKIALDHTS